MKIPAEIRKWMKEHTIEDLEELLLNDEYADRAEGILEILSEMNESEDLISLPEEVLV